MNVRQPERVSALLSFPRSPRVTELVAGEFVGNKKLFADLVESMTQMNGIVRGERAPSREFKVDAVSIKELRSRVGLSQTKFAALLHVNVGTLRNWEPGPARANGTGQSARGSYPS